MRHAFASILLIAAVAAAARAQDADPDTTGVKNFDMLHVEMKLRVLAGLQKHGFYIPREWVMENLLERDQLAKELQVGGGKQIEALDDWVTESKKSRKAETDTMMKLAETWGTKFLKKAAASGKDPGVITVWREYEKEMAEWKLSRKQS